MIIYQWTQVSQFIRFKIDIFDEKVDDLEAEMQDSRPDTMKQGGSFKIGHIVLGSVQKQTSFEDVSAAHKNDPAFSRFYSRFRQFLQTRYSSEFADLDTVLSQNFRVSFL
jgi:hypothetical protein